MDRYPMNDVVVVLPGITGSVLKKDGKVAWGYSAGTIAGALLSRGGNVRSKLALPHDDPDVDDLGDGITADELMPDLHLLPGLWKIDGYSALIEALLPVFELQEGRNFFRFPYDWRRHNKVAARKLARASHDWLRAWRESGHENPRLILIAHSMGGLVSRYFLECMEGWKHTRALITFGTPYRGSLNALDTLANGMRKGPIELSELARELSSLYELLPIFKCCDAGNGLERIGEMSGIPNVVPARAAAALAFHREIEQAVATNHALPQFERDGYQVHPIVGVAQTTHVSGRVKEGGVEMLTTAGDDIALGGDGTVPRYAAVPIEMSKNPRGTVYAATKHGSLQNAEAVLDHLIGVLSGHSIDLGKFLKPKVQVALEIEDVFSRTEPLRPRMRPVRPGDVALEVALQRSDGTEIGRAVPRPTTSGWFTAEFPPPGPGAYRVSVTGPAVETAQDSCVVLEEQVTWQ